MATATSASSAAFGAKTPGPAPSPQPIPASAFARTSPRASASGRLRASLHLGGASATSSSNVVGNGSGIYLAPPVLAPLSVPKMSGTVGSHKSVLLFYCEEMRELAEQVVARNDDIELRSISWRSQACPALFSISLFFPSLNVRTLGRALETGIVLVYNCSRNLASGQPSIPITIAKMSFSA
ncbi:hypothetical protein ABZP36_016877 [Zizania latifolia]